MDDGENTPLLSPCGGEDNVALRASNHDDKSLAIKIAAAMFSFSTLGLFNSSIGAALPHISRYYSLTDLHVSLLFLVAPVGYILAAQFSDTIHYHSGQRGIALVGPILQFAATLLIALHPKFEWVLVAFAVQGLGSGLLDGSWCAWAGNMKKANTISGLLHGSYSVGGAAGPFFITVITTKQESWYKWYYVMAALSVCELFCLVFAFWNETASRYRQNKQADSQDNKTDTKAIFRYSATWICAAYFLAYVGTETAISGWVVSFMLRTRNATPYLAGICSTGFWMGMAIGRLVLGFVTDRIGVRRATALYFVCAIGLEVLFALLKFQGVSAILMTLLGFIMGPLFPSGVVILTRLLPVELHVAAVSFVSSLGQIGGAFFPFAIGAVVQSLGIGVFRFAILAQTVSALVLWLGFARVRPTVPTINTRENHTRED